MTPPALQDLRNFSAATLGVAVLLKVLLATAIIASGFVPILAVVLGIALVVFATWASPEPTTKSIIAQAVWTGFLAGAAAAGINVGFDAGFHAAAGSLR